MEELKNQAKSLRRDGIEALLNYEVWWTIRSPARSKLHIETLNKYSAYFEVAVNAHFVAMILPLYRIFETRKNSINLPQLVKKLRSKNVLEKSVLTNIEQQIQALNPTWIKIAKLRNEVFGHRSAKYDIEQSFARAKITPNDIEKLVRNTLVLLNEVDGALNEEYHSYKMGAGENLVSILNALRGSV